MSFPLHLFFLKWNYGLPADISAKSARAFVLYHPGRAKAARPNLRGF
jgi:hypothetical protein